jgi:serine/threonine protein kinase
VQPAFPTLYDVHEHDGQLYLAMEFMQGERAGNFMQRPLCPAHVLAVGIQLADALVALHSLGVVHRDIHGSNVLIDFAAGPVTRPIVRLLDLGMCELLPAWFARVHRYGTPPEHRVALGTGGLEQFAWTAPEARRERVWTEKCDVWSAGLLLFQLLTGHRPSPAGSDDPPVSPRTWVSCSTELSHALLAALHPDPSHRLDASGLLARLTEAAELQAAEEH